MIGRPPSAPLYTLPHGIEVIGEYGPNTHFPYWRLRVRPHPFFSGKIVNGGILAHRSRVVMSAKLGRALLQQEHVHHRNEDLEDDSPENLKLISAGDHNRLHKTGTHHTEEVKQRIRATMIATHRDRPENREQSRVLALKRRRDNEGRFVSL